MDGAHRLRRDRLVALCFVLFGLSGWLWGTYAYGVFGAYGSDPDIWVYSSLNIGVRAPSVGPPGYPVAVWFIQLISGLSAVSAAVWVSLLSTALLPAATYLLGRAFGLSWRYALVPAVLAPMLPGIREFGHQTQPDALTTLGLTLGAILVHRAVHSERLADWMWAVGVVGLLALLREHGMVLVATVGLLALCSPGDWRHRVLRVVVPVAIWGLGSSFFALEWVWPWAAPWHRRVTMAVEAVGAVNLASINGVALPSYVTEMNFDQLERFRDLYANEDRVGIVKFHVMHSIESAVAAWLWIVIGVLAAFRSEPKNRWVLLSFLVVVFPTLFIWTKSRHLEVLIPIAVVSVLVAVVKAPRWALLLFVFGVGHWTAFWPKAYNATLDRLQREAIHYERIKAFGQALCEEVEPGDLVAGPEVIATLYCPLPRHAVQNDGGAGDWHTWHIGHGDLGEDWHYVEVGEAIYPVRRLKPWLVGEERPCRDVKPVSNASFHQVQLVSAEMEGTCRGKTF